MQVAAERSRANPSVMLVDDDRDMVEALAVALEGAGYQVDCCYDGGEALEHLSLGTLPDLIILDLGMPRVDGWQFRAEQRNHEEWAAIPVIVLSADSSAPAKTIDADRFLPKPIGASALLETVERLMLARERVRFEGRAAELDRFSSLGVLAAGLAHEVNNPLATVLGNLTLASRQCAALSAAKGGSASDATLSLQTSLDRARQGAERIADAVRGMSAFARPDTERLLPMNVQDVMESSLALMSNEIRHHARLVRDYASVPPVLGNPTQLGQVFINLLINAVRAIGKGHASHNTIRVATRLGDDSNVIVAVEDSGSGIAPERIGRLFEPFVSTMDAGGGEGLGLSMSQRLVVEMGGSIEVQSMLGSGSTFKIRLPAHRPAAAPRTLDVRAAEARASVLVIDDEPTMCTMLAELLSPQFAVTAFRNSRAALERLLCGGPFDIILCDIMMPELSGMALYTEVIRAKPEQAQRFIFMTGGVFTQGARDFVSSIDAPVLGKPFDPDLLEQTILGRLRVLSPASYH